MFKILKKIYLFEKILLRIVLYYLKQNDYSKNN